VALDPQLDEDRALLASDERGAPRFFVAYPLPYPPPPNETVVVRAEGASVQAARAFVLRIGGRIPVLTIERWAVSPAPWPEREPATAPDYRIERGGWVVLAPSPALGVRLWDPDADRRVACLVMHVTATPPDEAAGRVALARCATRALLARVHHVIDKDAGGDLRAIVKSARRIERVF
jgi:hypothetical protein